MRRLIAQVEALFRTEISEFGRSEKPGQVGVGSPTPRAYDHARRYSHYRLPLQSLLRIHPLRDFAMPGHLQGKLLFLTQVC